MQCLVKSSRSTCRALGQPVNEIEMITEINHQRVGLLELFPWSFWGEEQFGDLPIGLALSHFRAEQLKKSTLYNHMDCI